MDQIWKSLLFSRIYGTRPVLALSGAKNLNDSEGLQENEKE
jgi:hypothetical protein